jgi:hypothetical protein
MAIGSTHWRSESRGHGEKHGRRGELPAAHNWTCRRPWLARRGSECRPNPSSVAAFVMLVENAAGRGGDSKGHGWPFRPQDCGKVRQRHRFLADPRGAVPRKSKSGCEKLRLESMPRCIAGSFTARIGSRNDGDSSPIALASLTTESYGDYWCTCCVEVVTGGRSDVRRRDKSRSAFKAEEQTNVSASIQNQSVHTN